MAEEEATWEDTCYTAVPPTMALVLLRAEAKDSELAGVTVETHSVQVGADSWVQVLGMLDAPGPHGLQSHLWIACQVTLSHTGSSDKSQCERKTQEIVSRPSRGLTVRVVFANLFRGLTVRVGRDPKSGRSRASG